MICKEDGGPLRFKVSKEDWSTFMLSDGTELRVKLVVTRIGRFSGGFNVDVTPPIVSSISPSELKGPPNSNEQPERTSPVDVLQEECPWNEYVLEDGTTIPMKLVIWGVKRSLSKFDKRGEPLWEFGFQIVEGPVRKADGSLA